MDDALFIAVDLGAGSGRVFLCGLGPNELLLEEVRRFQYPPREIDGHLRWDFAKILKEIKSGLYGAGERARELGRRVQSIGVASWGVDYGLVDETGRLLEDPICYRDSRTQGVMDQVFACITKQELFTRTGVQFMPFNTLFQLYAHARDEGLPREAHRLLLIPDLVNLSLTGRVVTEYTNATTTQMINAVSGTWDTELLNRVDLPAKLMPELISAGEVVGPLRLPEADEFGLANTQVLAPATHDTGSAVVGTPLDEDWAFISSGTWSLVGVERDSVLIDSRVFADNFTNEGGAFGTIRFLKNVMGLWILESCRREWRQRGVNADYDTLFARLREIDEYPALIFPDDERFFKPASMLDALMEQLTESDARLPDDPITITKMILDSLAFRYASVLKTIESLTGQRIKGVQIVGGGSRNDYLNQMTANASNLPVAAGPVEATVIGNVLVQGIAAGRFSSLADGRRYVAQNVKAKRFNPCVNDALREAMDQYRLIEQRYV
ncbi:MAG TPA: rhamnulokinase family protein [Pyrinomonadaceae bacterium]|nr:rhamnulokinase family protein [Pyrinomonadaceae bacterium]